MFLFRLRFTQFTFKENVWIFIDNAYACDPRIARFKEEAKQKKLQEKEAKKEAARKRQEEEEKVCLIIIQGLMLGSEAARTFIHLVVI